MEHGRAPETERDRALVEIEAALSDLLRVGKNWNRALAARFGGELSPLAFGVLRYVLNHAPVRSSDIVNSFELDKATVSRAIKVLRDKGLIEASPDPRDGRASILVPTDQAVADFERYREETRRDYRAALDQWSETDLADLSRLISRLAAAIPTGPGAASAGQ